MKTSTKAIARTLAATAIVAAGAVSAQLPPLVIGDFGVFSPQRDIKVHAGSFCQPQHGAQAGDLNHWPGGTQNVSTAPRIINCPIVRDNTLNGNGTLGVTMRVRNPGGRLRCTLFSVGPLNNPIVVSQASTTTPGDQLINLSVNSSVAGGQYNVSCTLPSRAFILNYQLTEFRPTDTN